MNQSGKIFFNSRVETDLSVFKQNMDIVLAIRMVADLEDVKEKYSRATYLEYI